MGIVRLKVSSLIVGSDAMRTDLSATLFLSDPADYDGGELVVDEHVVDEL